MIPSSNKIGEKKKERRIQSFPKITFQLESTQILESTVILENN